MIQNFVQIQIVISSKVRRAQCARRGGLFPLILVGMNVKSARLDFFIILATKQEDTGSIRKGETAGSANQA